MTVHRTLTGGWAECATLNCRLKFHFDNLTLTAAEGLPLLALLPLLEVLDPPTEVNGFGTKLWRDTDRVGVVSEIHRDYDLPAVVRGDGTLQWRQHGELHRDHDRPAAILQDGTQQWYKHGQLHREDDKPAIIYLDGEVEYWLNNKIVPWAEAR